jgi:hypothetical protein
MKHFVLPIACASVVAFSVAIVRQEAHAQSSQPTDQPGAVGSKANGAGSSLVLVTEMPSGYRDWRFISVAHEEGNLHSFAAVLGNDVAIKAYREGTLPYPDGTIIAALHYHHVPSEENNRIFGRDQSFVPGDPSNIQFMIKDSKKYSATGGWGFGHFQDGKPLTDKVKIEGCFECHERIKERDLVFTRYAP